MNNPMFVTPQYKFVTPYYTPIVGEPPVDPDARFYPPDYDKDKFEADESNFYVAITSSMRFRKDDDEESPISLYVEFMDKPSTNFVTVTLSNNSKRNVVVFDSTICTNILGFEYLKYPLGPVEFVNEFDILLVYYWFNAFINKYSKYEPDDEYEWMWAAINTVKYFGSERCMSAVEFYESNLSNTIHNEAISNIKRFAKLSKTYDNHDLPTIMYALCSAEPFGGLHHAKPIK